MKKDYICLNWHSNYIKHTLVYTNYNSRNVKMQHELITMTSVIHTILVPRLFIAFVFYPN